LTRKEAKVKCPDCKEPIELKTTSQKTGAIIGSGIGGIVGFISRTVGTRAGIAIGSGICAAAMPMPFIAVGAVAGGLAGALTGFVAGGALGSKVGKLVDENYTPKYHCPNCGKTVKS
jgi:predicted RNA-binding Zn-ribbon protein involved in translation (DUF1610 family)